MKFQIFTAVGGGEAARGVTVKVGSNTSFGTPAWDWAMDD